MSRPDYSRAVSLTKRAEPLDVTIKWLSSGGWRAYCSCTENVIVTADTLDSLECLIRGIEWAYQEPEETA